MAVTERENVASLSSILCRLIFVLLISADTDSRLICQEGTFGWECRFRCYCKNNSPCHPVTGFCKKGCEDNKYGVGCLLSTDCMYDDKGINYTGFKRITTGGAKCLNWNSKVGRSYGYRPYHFADRRYPKNFCRNPDMGGGVANKPWCLVRQNRWMTCDIKRCQCMFGRFGDSCLKECHCKDRGEECNKEIGTCRRSGCASGWLGTGCQEPCPGGYHGVHCLKKCGHCAVGTCDPEKGTCEYGCSAGWTGPLCQTKCRLGKFGTDCRKRCGKCLLKATCDRKSGKCPHGKCQQGWNGRTCNKRCDTKTWGMGCQEICGDCKDGEACDPHDGKCPHGCNPGWSGYRCISECQDGKYGENCSLSCGFCRRREPCDRYTGSCLSGCEDGYEGRVCRTALSRSVEVATASGIAAAVVIVIVALLIIFLFLRKRKFNRKGQYTIGREEGLNLTDHTKETQNLLVRKDAFEIVEGAEKLDNDMNEMNDGPIYENVDLKKPSQPVLLADLEEYIKSHKENNNVGFKREYEQLPTGLLAVHNIADKEGNKSKNRYGNIVAYDHSRVTLKPLASDIHSDYVNASFIDGYEQPEAYIASQGPNKAMLNDFWRLVWQRDINKIVMLTNLVEACKRKCEQYWPEVDCTEMYGDIQVATNRVIVYTDYTVRTFNIIHIPEQLSRAVVQYHFTAWSDHGAPAQPTSVLAFIRKVNQFCAPSIGPVLTHCSAGIGRTGTFIAINNLMCQAKEENCVDVLACVGLMRANRVNMIQNLEQYMFVYDAVYEALTAGDTTISYDDLPAKYAEMIDIPPRGEETLLMKQFQIVQKFSPTIERYEYKTAITEVNILKNRYRNILPSNRCRPYLYTVVDGCNDYINAVFIHGFTHRDAFLVTQMPMPNTMADFWRMMFDYNSCLVVMLNDFERDDETCALYWPEEHGYPVTHGPLSIELLMSSEADSDVTVREFKLSHSHKPTADRAVKQIVFKSWPRESSTPGSVASFLRLVEMITSLRGESLKGPVTIHCMDGATRSGLLCAACLLYDSIHIDSEIDMFQIVKQIRANRPQFIESLDQYRFLYELALEMRVV